MAPTAVGQGWSLRRSCPVVFCIALGLGAIGCSRMPPISSVRRATYEAPLLDLITTTSYILNKNGYPIDDIELDPDFTLFKVGPFFYDANKQNRKVLPAQSACGWELFGDEASKVEQRAGLEAAHEGSYRVMLLVSAAEDQLGRYLDIRPEVARREGGEWKSQRLASNDAPPRPRRQVDPFRRDRWLARLAEPIYKGVYARLKLGVWLPGMEPKGNCFGDLKSSRMLRWDRTRAVG